MKYAGSESVERKEWEPLSQKLIETLLSHFEDGEDLIETACIMLASLKMAEEAIRLMLRKEGFELTGAILEEQNESN